MTEFDPKRHAIVAVVTDPESKEKGQHFHLPLPELVQEANELEAPVNALAPAQSSQDLVDVIRRLTELENRPQSTEIITAQPGGLSDLDSQRIDAVARLVKNLESRIQTLENRPHLSSAEVNNLSSALNERVKFILDEQLGELRGRISKLENAPAGSASETMKRLQGATKELTGAVISLTRDAADLHDKIEQKGEGFAAQLTALEGRFKKRIGELARITMDDMAGVTS